MTSQRGSILGALALLLLALLSPTPIGAQELPGLLRGKTEAAAPAPAAEPSLSAAEIKAHQAELIAELEAVESELATASTANAAYLEKVRTRLEKIDVLLTQQADQVASSTEVAGERPASGAPSPLGAAPVASAFTLNALLAERFGDGRAAARQEEKLTAAREALAQAKEEFESAERKRRLVRNEWEAADSGATDAAQQALRIRQLNSRIAQEELHLRTLELREVQKGGTIDPKDEARLDAAIREVRAQLAEGRGDARAEFAALGESEAQLQRVREATERRLASAELRLAAAQNRFSTQSEPPPELLEEVEALTARRDAIRQEIALVDAQRARIAEQRSVWQRWESLLREDAPPDDLDDWQKEAAERIAALQSEESSRKGRVADLQQRISAIENRLVRLAPGSRLRPTLEEQRQTLLGLQAAQLTEVAALASDRLVTERFAEDLRQKTGHVEFFDYLARGSQAIGDVWKYEITTVDDAPISVGSLVLALLFFGIGFWAARQGSAVVGRVASDRFKLDVGGANALQTLSFYALLIGFMLMALRAVHFPLTAFTVLGGALAIGIGFGSQNVMNNFISGLILMLERPVRASDVVEVDGSHGTIERIGARSTQIRSTDGRHIVVPNSFFLESNVVNWTLSDDLIRAKVSVGVIYGSPTRLVEQLIRRAVEEDKEVIMTPKPLIIFEEFGDNSLNFDTYFWVRARTPMAVRNVQSRVRFAIDDLFREHDLVIAFPQRDVHLDTVSPIEVRVLDPK